MRRRDAGKFVAEPFTSANTLNHFDRERELIIAGKFERRNAIT
jgi:hypothetical protein